MENSNTQRCMITVGFGLLMFAGGCVYHYVRTRNDVPNAEKKAREDCAQRFAEEKKKDEIRLHKEREACNTAFQQKNDEIRRLRKIIEQKDGEIHCFRRNHKHLKENYLRLHHANQQHRSKGGTV